MSDATFAMLVDIERRLKLLEFERDREHGAGSTYAASAAQLRIDKLMREAWPLLLRATIAGGTG